MLHCITEQHSAAHYATVPYSTLMVHRTTVEHVKFYRELQCTSLYYIAVGTLHIVLHHRTLHHIN